MGITYFHPFHDSLNEVTPVPSGKVKWYDADKGFGFLTRDDGGEVFVHSSALPGGVDSLKPGQKVEFGVAEGRRGQQALSVRVIDQPRPSPNRPSRRASARSPTRWSSSWKT
nr:hypothetical protein GCM10020093_066510 [Planobispora longispora]